MISPKAFMRLHIGTAVLYAVVVALFIWAMADKIPEAVVLTAVILIFGPPLYYPIVYIWVAPRCPGEQERVKLYGELWGPLWAALSAIWLLAIVECPHWRGERSECSSHTPVGRSASS